MKYFVFFWSLIYPFIANSQTRYGDYLSERIEGKWEQDSDRNIFYEKSINNNAINNDVLFEVAKNFFTRHFNSQTNVITSIDPIRKTITGEGIWPEIYVGYVNNFSYTYSVYYKLNLEIQYQNTHMSITISKYHIKWQDPATNLSVDRDHPIIIMFPLNRYSERKNMDDKVFYSMHYKSLGLIKALENNLTNVR